MKKKMSKEAKKKIEACIENIYNTKIMKDMKKEKEKEEAYKWLEEAKARMDLSKEDKLRLLLK